VTSDGSFSDQPDPALVRKAIGTWLDRHAVLVPEDSVSWKIIDQERRRYSQVYTLAFWTKDVSAAVGNAFYKEMTLPVNVDASTSGRRHLQIQQSLDLARKLNPNLSGIAAESGVDVAPVLAVDIDRRVIVTEGLPGHQLLDDLPRRITVLHIRNLITMLERLGRLCRVVESLDADEPDVSSNDEYREAYAWPIAKLRNIPLDLSADLHHNIDDLLAQALTRSNPVVWAHGDLSPTNVLVAPSGRLGVFDFRWVARFRGYDLGVLGARLETSATDGMTRNAIVRGLSLGYGMPGVQSEPGWRLARLLVHLRRALRLQRSGREKAAQRLVERASKHSASTAG
jgi:hypothetical protein